WLGRHVNGDVQRVEVTSEALELARLVANARLDRQGGFDTQERDLNGICHPDAPASCMPPPAAPEGAGTRPVEVERVPAAEVSSRPSPAAPRRPRGAPRSRAR